MVHHDIKQNSNAALMGAINQRPQVVFAAHIGIEFAPVLCVVTVVSIMREITVGAASDPAVDLLKRRAYPQRVDAELLEIIQLTGQALQIARPWKVPISCMPSLCRP
ncbi:Uncharacterised protein [Kluyvera cryocrescens]|uniref:Uncharacterized protein n=1 Tax=Kluyvera cryocrescens TaxID=580 RepID=A0A485AP76_KLUCR|nr:Uncharacterised protein [Kluyvera cryocrescens]